jgi:uncharacterized membrane protein
MIFGKNEQDDLSKEQKKSLESNDSVVGGSQVKANYSMRWWRVSVKPLSIAKDADALIVLRFRPGQFVLRGEPLAKVVPAERFGRIEAAIDRGIHIGRHRTLTQDLSSASHKWLRSRSARAVAAINDTFTGIACDDWLADALLTLAERPPVDGNWYDIGHRLRVWMPPLRLERLAKFAFDQIRQASATTPAVLIHRLNAILRLAPRLPSACHQVLSEQADAIVETASGLVALDRRDLDAAWRRAHSAIEARGASSDESA